MSTPTLGYWKIRGLASAIRYQLEYSGVHYENKEYAQGNAPEFDKSEWLTAKFNLGLDFPNIPYFMDGDLKMTETFAIHQYIADKWKPELLGRTSEERALVNMVSGPLHELKGKTTIPAYVSGSKTDVKTAIKGGLPPIWKFKGANKFLVGNEPTWVDFFFYEMVQTFLLSWANVYNEFDGLEDYMKAVANLPGLKEYLESERCLEKKRAFNNTQAKINSHVSYKLWYFPVYGRGEPIRMLLAKAGIHFDERTVTMEEWPSIKPSMPNQVVPCLELVNGQKLGETVPLMRLLAHSHGFYPSDFELAGKSDEITDEWEAVYHNVPGPAFMQPGEERDAAITKAIEGVSKFLKAIEPHIKNNKFIGGDELSYTDFLVGGCIYLNTAANPQVYESGKWNEMLNQHPNFKAYGERFRAEMSAYLASDKRRQAFI